MNATPQPGDFCCVSTSGPLGPLIGLGERLCGDAFTQYQHAFVYVGSMLVIEAEAAGARTRKLASFRETGAALWSTGRVRLTGQQRDVICLAARGYIGIPYSWLDYFAIAAHRLRLHPLDNLLKARIASDKSLICSQLVDAAYQAAGVKLFDDGRWNGYVTPADLAAVIENAPAA